MINYKNDSKKILFINKKNICLEKNKINKLNEIIIYNNNNNNNK